MGVEGWGLHVLTSGLSQGSFARLLGGINDMIQWLIITFIDDPDISIPLIGYHISFVDVRFVGAY